MKKFLMYTVVLVSMLFVGYTTYYFLRNNENIFLTLAEGESIYINKDDIVDFPIGWTKAYKSTKVYENVDISNSDVLSFDAKTKKLIGLKGGIVQVVVTPSNKDFGPFRFDVHVGDGSLLYPYYINSAEKLLDVGKTENWKLSSSYKIIHDIDLKEVGDTFSPIGTTLEPFTGTFDGGNKNISNLNIETGENVGLFGVAESSSIISNINLVNPNIVGSFTNAGGIVGFNKGIIRLCNVKNLHLENTKDNSNNGGISGYTQNTSLDNQFVSFGYIDMCKASTTAKTAGNFGGITGVLEGGIIYNSQSVIKSYTELANSVSYGSLAGNMKNAHGVSEYMFSIIKNSYTLVENLSFANSVAKKGAIVGVNEDIGTAYKNALKSIYYSIKDTTLEKIGQSSVEVDTSTVLEKTMAELYKKETYVGWDFENIWGLEEDVSSAEILFETAEAQPLNEYIPGNAIKNKEDLFAVLDSLRQDPSRSVVYEITEDLGVIDLNGAEWITIAPNETNPLKSSIVCKDAGKLTFSNFKLTTANPSVFGHISGANTLIKGINFEKVIVDSNAKLVAVIANSIMDNACIESIEINDVTVTLGENVETASIVVDINKGKVNNIKVNNKIAEVNKITQKGLNTTFGGIVANNESSVVNCEISLFDMNVVTDAVDDAFINYGGIVGISSKGKITDCYNYDCSFNIEQINGVVNAGGVAYKISNTIVLRCFSEGKITLPFTNKQTSVAGVVVFADTNSAIKQSYYSHQTLQASEVGGVAHENQGSIDQCYFQGEAKGIKVAGIAVKNTKAITNCYVLGSLIGLTSDSKCSGIVSILPTGGSVDHCFSSAAFSGQGERHAETEAEFRVTIEKALQIFGMYPNTGTFKNSIIINYGDAYVKGTFFGASKPGWIDCSVDQAKGLDGDYSPFKKDAGFDQTIWIFDNNEGQGAYPTLKFVVKNPNA